MKQGDLVKTRLDDCEYGELDIWYDGDVPLVGVLLRPWDEMPGWWFVMMNDEVTQWPENQLELV